MAILSNVCTPDNFESRNSLKLALRILEAFFRILLMVNLSMNQTLLTFFLHMRPAWMTQLILAVSL